ncbi:CDP-diacylglycerol--glycerol-3-phosphate 3-phosphatidyltransferase [Acholeplasma sp. OttesenSCG-928-E16]|nr:CDP-diacylglycerol--glycerol-3-phosphate 3-phosphatidyltransferase [Acholeplasma sp. OttesenSCG-928-E16]
METKTKRKVTLANKITISRMCLIPLMIVVISIPALHGYAVIDLKNWQLNLAELIFAVIFCIAAGTDFLDGYFARKRNEITTFGKFLDPIADKMLVVVGFIYLVYMQRVDMWVLAIIILREFIVSGIRLLAVEKGEVIAASMWGKVKTFSTMVVLIFMLFNQFGIAPFGDMGDIVGYFNIGRILCWIVAIITVISGIDYFIKSKKIVLESI